MKGNNKELRLVFLCDGTGMGDTLYLFKTNAPVEVLKKLERTSCEAYLSGDGYDDVPIWSEELEKLGYEFQYVNERQHIDPFGGSDMLRNEYPNVTEEYVIENQPDIR